MRFWLLFFALLTGTVHAQPDPQLFGWAGEKVAAEAKAALAQAGTPVTELTVTAADLRDVRGQSVFLWYFTKRVNGGNHIPNVAQQIGDCVSFGNGHACEYAMAAEICMGADTRFQRVYKPFLYGTGRVQVGGGRIRGDGSTGAWQARALEQYGAIAVDEPNVPPYSGSVAKKWGYPPGPPAEFLPIGKQYLAKTKLVTSYDAACEAIANGWPVAVCSSAGFGKIDVANNRVEGSWNTTWPHCMCFVAFDDREGRQALCCLNSWGPNAHIAAGRYAELDGAPPGSFWVRKADAEKMLRQGDSYAISFNGFTRRLLSATTEYSEAAKAAAANN